MNKYENKVFVGFEYGRSLSKDKVLLFQDFSVIESHLIFEDGEKAEIFGKVYVHNVGKHDWEAVTELPDGYYKFGYRKKLVYIGKNSHSE